MKLFLVVDVHNEGEKENSNKPRSGLLGDSS